MALALVVSAALASARPAATVSTGLRVTEVRGLTTRVVAVAADGTKRVLASSPRALSVSPDGRFRAWTVPAKDSTRLLVARVGKGAAKTVATFACPGAADSCATHTAVAWSRTNRLAFVAYSGGHAQVTVGVARADGRILHRFTYPGMLGARKVYYFGPQWASDGRRLALVRSELQSLGEQSHHVDVVDTVGWGIRRVARLASRYGAQVAWTPNGRSLGIIPVRSAGFPSKDPGYLVVHAATGRTVARSAHCSTGPGCPNGGGGPAWSPDGRQVAYATDSGVARAAADLSGATFVVESPTAPGILAWTRDGLLVLQDRAVVALDPATGSVKRTVYTSPSGWSVATVEAAVG
jgi:hypothetical protein